ncbi:MAG TPA: 50S ribosomal protein L11 methyltransferase [Pyrinomonadaceae bacterium]|jgi:ribosomal protein L11 methyltransferase|nr:50S ribosomal protein L11 methyltransferase [Pyrinomonadaceae bacterium]
MTSASQNKNWLAVEIEILREAAEAVEFALLEVDALGTAISTPVKNKDDEFLTVTGYFNEEVKLQDALNEALRIYGFSHDAVKRIQWSKVEQRDWLAEWKKSWQPVGSGRFIVAPTWSEIPESPDKIIIRIEPGMAFGTGTHETTRLCLSAIDKCYDGGSFLDVGTGTAILAIAAAKMFAGSKVEACDTDPDALQIARENAQLNHAGNIIFYEGSITRETEHFDFVCANLTADVILPLLSLLVEKAQKTLVLSGILIEQEVMIANKLVELDRKDFAVNQLGEWISVVVNCQK